MRGLGDIVTMPLPTDYGPEVYAQAVQAGLTITGFPGSGPGLAPGAPPATAAGSGGPAASMPPGSQLNPAGALVATGGRTQNGLPFGAPLTPDAGLPWWSNAPASRRPDAAGAWPSRALGPGGLMVPGPTVGRGPGTNPNAWTRPPQMPDWMLPPALQRTNPLLRQTTYARNQWDNRLLRQAWIWQWIAQHGGIKSCCHIPELGAPVYDIDPRQAMPSQAQEFQQMNALPFSSFAPGVDETILSFRVPEGYDGVLNRFVCGYSGSGFVDFSGSIVWRVKIGVRYARNLGNVTNTYGSFDTSFLVPGSHITLVSGQSVTLLANIPVGSPVSGGFVQAGVFGYFYPRR
jgi:hypothetical protein